MSGRERERKRKRKLSTRTTPMRAMSANCVKCGRDRELRYGWCFECFADDQPDGGAQVRSEADRGKKMLDMLPEDCGPNGACRWDYDLNDWVPL